nr:MaoC family dehydratase [Planctomycetota bacterium]
MTKKINLGDSASLTRSFSEAEIAVFAEVSGDHNPVHLDEAFARATPFGGRIAHGMLGASVFSGLLGSELPGSGTIYLGQSLKFMQPVRLDQEVVFRVEVVAIHEAKPILTMRTTCTDLDGKLAIDG